VSLCMASVFPDPYNLKLTFEMKRNQSEAVIKFQKDKSESLIDPEHACGGGPVDVAAFGFRISLMTLMKQKTRPVLILDEPFRFVSRGLQDKASQLLQEVSGRLGIQMIIVTHEEALIEEADQVFEVSLKNRISRVKEV